MPAASRLRDKFKSATTPNQLTYFDIFANELQFWNCIRNLHEKKTLYLNRITLYLDIFYRTIALNAYLTYFIQHRCESNHIDELKRRQINYLATETYLHVQPAAIWIARVTNKVRSNSCLVLRWWQKKERIRIVLSSISCAIERGVMISK